MLSANTEATTAAAELKSAIKRSKSRTAPLLDACATVMSRFRPARNDFLRTFRLIRDGSLSTIPTNFPTPLASTYAVVMIALRTVLADSLRMFRPVRADLFRITLADPLSSARLLLARRSFRVCRLPTLTPHTIASSQPAVRPGLYVVMVMLTRVLAIETPALVATSRVLTANQEIHKVKPRGSEPLTSAVQRRIHNVAVVRRCSKTPSNKHVLPRISLCSTFFV